MIKKFDVVDIHICFRSISLLNVQTLGSAGATTTELAGIQRLSQGLKQDA